MAPQRRTNVSCISLPEYNSYDDDNLEPGAGAQEFFEIHSNNNLETGGEEDPGAVAQEGFLGRCSSTPGRTARPGVEGHPFGPTCVQREGTDKVAAVASSTTPLPHHARRRYLEDRRNGQSGQSLRPPSRTSKRSSGSFNSNMLTESLRTSRRKPRRITPPRCTSK